MFFANSPATAAKNIVIPIMTMKLFTKTMIQVSGHLQRLMGKGPSGRGTSTGLALDLPQMLLQGKPN